uniref:U1620b n=1 Tax=Mycobacterium leprae TaxID=1769 RepID=Q49731_MYCLR|nr:u1620b [Mycobacterium leprae]
MVNVHALITTDVNAEGYRETLGCGCDHRRRRGRLVEVSAVADRPLAFRRGYLGHQRCPRRTARHNQGQPPGVFWQRCRIYLGHQPHGLRTHGFLTVGAYPATLLGV